MNESQPLNLTLGDPPPGLKRREAVMPARLLGLLVLTQVATLFALAVVLWRTGGATDASVAAGHSTHADELRATAKELEDKGLEAEAAGTWQSYLLAAPDAPDRAEILYRIGKLRIAAQQYGAAAAALVEAEEAAGGNKDLTTKIGPLVVQCLSRLGRYGEVGRELARRVEVGAAADAHGKAKVLATITGQSLTDADLDRLAERRVDNMLALEGAAGDAERRQAILQQLSTPAARRQLLQELLQIELFCRRGRELKLDQEEGFRQACDETEQTLLAQRFLAKELHEIQPTAVDIESYYQANLPQYAEKKSGRTPPLKEIAAQVRADYVARKQQEAGERLSRDLMIRYDVRIVPPESPAKEAAAATAGSSSSAAGAKGLSSSAAKGDAAQPVQPPAKVEKLSK
jgi:hypothetical protein